MSLTSAQKAEIVKEFKRGDKDTGSPEVQVSLMTGRIKYLTDHFKDHKKIFILDVACRNWLTNAASCSNT